MESDLDAQLIELIRVFPALYNAKLPSFKDVRTKENNWQYIATKLDMKVVDIQRRWITLRDAYAKQLREERKPESGDGARKKKRLFKYFDQMHFLNNFIKPRKRTFGNDANRSYELSPNQSVQSFETSTEMKESEKINTIVIGEKELTEDDETVFSRLQPPTAMYWGSSTPPLAQQDSLNLWHSPPGESVTPTRESDAVTKMAEVANELVREVRSSNEAILEKLDNKCASDNDDPCRPYCEYLYTCLKKLSSVEFAHFEVMAAKFFLDVELKNHKQ